MPKYQKTDMSDVFTQKFEGSVTITPPVTVQDFVLLFRDPNAERMANFINGGQRRTWAKLPMIINRLRLEKALRDCRRKVLAADMQFQSNKLVAVKVRSVYNNSNKNSSGGTNSVKLRKSASVGARISNSNSSSTNTSAATTSSSIFNIPQEHPTTIDESVFVKGDGISKPTTRKRNKRRSRRLSSTAPPPSPAGLCDSAYASSSFYSVLSDI